MALPSPHRRVGVAPWPPPSARRHQPAPRRLTLRILQQIRDLIERERDRGLPGGGGGWRVRQSHTVSGAPEQHREEQETR